MYQFDNPYNPVETLEESITRYSTYEWFGAMNRDNTHKWYTYGQTGKRIDNTSNGLGYPGIGKYDKAVITSINRIERAATGYALYGRRTGFVSINAAELVSARVYLIKDSSITVLFVLKTDTQEETQAVVTADGGLRTGDRAFIDDEGFMYITGRAGESFMLESGRWMSPPPLRLK